MKQIIVEVDFEHSEGEVTCRLYRLKDGQKELLRTQDIFNLVQQVRKGRENGWSADDQKLLKQFWPILNKPHILRTNLQVVKVPKRKFDLWLELWKTTPDRFIEKSSQQMYNQDRVNAKVHFELDCHGPSSTLSAVVTAENGRQIPYYQIFQQAVHSTTQFLFEGQRLDLQFPIKKEILDQIFGKKNPQIPTDKIEDHLPTILQGRLDLLEGSSIRKIDKTCQPTIRLVASGADILIAIFVGSEPIRQLQTEPYTPMKLCCRGDFFEIYSYSHEILPEIIGKFSQLPLQKSYKEYWKLQGVTENVSRLYEIYTEFQDRVSFDIDQSLLTLFDNQSSLESTLMVHEGSGWLDIHFHCHKGQVQIENSDIQRIIESKQEFIRTRKGEWLQLNFGQISELKDHMAEHGFHFGQQRVTKLNSKKIISVVEQHSKLRIHESSNQLINRLRCYDEICTPEYSRFLLKTLRTYQKEGADFLFNRTSYDLGCILADDMGLGKTIQVLACLAAYKIKYNRTLNVLVICPASVSSVWLKEVERFTPELRISQLSGSKNKRKSILLTFKDFDIIVGSYATVRNDLSLLNKQRFDVVILDEAQQIKNPETDVTRAVKSLLCNHRIALTGTPLENKIIDLWSIVDFLNPGYLGTLTDFKDRNLNDIGKRQELSKKISPFLLRRLKRQVAPQLPPKIEETIYLPLSDEQMRTYTNEITAARTNILKSKPMEIFAALTRLRQICSHLHLLPNKGYPGQPAADSLVDLESHSSKLKYLIDHLLELKEEGHSALVFSQFTTMLEIIEKALEKHKTKIYKIIGETPVSQRAGIVDNFQNDRDPAIFLLSLKAAGTGLTLTKADYVFIFDPWWNPAVENQAIDRTHRIGQDKPVIAYRLVASDTIEEKIMKLKEEKQHLFSQIIDSTTSLPPNLKINDLITILAE